MNPSDYWSTVTNPATGAKFEQWLKALRLNHNGECDIDALMATEYGAEMTKLSELRYTFEEDSMGEACLAFYNKLGVVKEQFEAEDFFTRWFLFTPADMDPEHRYPLIFWHHGGGNPLETDEFSIHLSQMAGREKFILCMLQNTCWDNVDRVLNLLLEIYPVDSERVYIVGYSLGGQAANSALMRIPHRITAVAPCGAEVMPLWDHLNVRYTMEEAEKVTAAFVPVMEIVGQYEFPNFLPMNIHRPKKEWGRNESVNLYAMPGNDRAFDPTYPTDLPRADKSHPHEGQDPGVWKIGRLNQRLDTLGCDRVDVQKCLSYIDTPEDELHHALGFYGDREEIRNIGGIKHYIIDCLNAEGIPAFRYVGVENTPHWPLLMMGELTWEFFRQFRRDAKTGKIVMDTYEG